MTFAGLTDTLQPGGISTGATLVRARRYLCGDCYTITRVPLPTHAEAK